jgi:hypothetical protein
MQAVVAVVDNKSLAVQVVQAVVDVVQMVQIQIQ